MEGGARWSRIPNEHMVAMHKRPDPDRVTADSAQLTGAVFSSRRKAASVSMPTRKDDTSGVDKGERLIFIAAPDGQAGGGMGRVKDYILRSAPDGGGQFRLEPLIMRDMRGVGFSAVLLLRAMLRIFLARIAGRAALVHVNMGDRGSAARKAALLVFARLIGVPTLLHLHAVELERHYEGGGRLLRWLISLPFRAAVTIVVLGERYRLWLVETLDVPAAKIDILWNGVEVGSDTPVRTFVPGGTQTILFLGNMLERKGMSDFVAALGTLRDHRVSWRAVIAGGGYFEPYAAQADALGICDRISFTGWVDRSGAQKLLADADMLVLPSYEEGLPLVILEALGAGLPVICTPVGSIGEVLADSETALFCDPGDRAGLAASIDRLLADRTLQARLSAHGLAQFDRLFSLAAFQKSLFDIYEKRHGIHYDIADANRLS